MSEITTTVIAQSKFRGEVLNKVYRVWLFRKLLPVLLAEVLALTLVLYFLGRTVFIQRVIENALNVLFLNPPQIVAFGVDAFSGATFLTQIFSIAVIAFLALLVRHLTQGLLRLILVKENYFAKVKNR